MKILIFGGTGFLGQSLCEFFENENIDFCTVSRSSQKADYNIDISVFQDFEKLPINTFDVVINCATVLPGGNYLDSEYLNKIYKTNILGSQHICKWMDGQNSIQQIINCSTLVVVSKPWDLNLKETANTYPDGNHVLYCSSKLMQELIFKTFADLKSIALCQIRFSALYGEKMNWSGIICNLIDQARTQNKIELKNGGKVFADFLYIDDASKIIFAAINNKYIGILNGASGEEISLLHLAKVINSILDKEIEVKNVNDIIFEENRANIDIENLSAIIDTEQFTSIAEGIQKMISL